MSDIDKTIERVKELEAKSHKPDDYEGDDGDLMAFREYSANSIMPIIAELENYRKANKILVNSRDSAEDDMLKTTAELETAQKRIAELEKKLAGSVSTKDVASYHSDSTDESI